MYVPIEKMPDTSRLWIYQASRMLTTEEQQVISVNLKEFCAQWAAHGADLQTSFDVQHRRFIILAVNEQTASASGCSIDSSTHVIKNLEQQLKVEFFNRGEVGFLENGNISTFPVAELKKLFDEGRLNENSVTFNTLVATLGEWRNRPSLTVSESWLKRFIPKIPVA